ncbi:acetyl-CoA hydrolase/transferase family protein [bacterium]|nr:acetyl-CoA hydrolase/transferase family protein [bacterium]
MKKAKYVSVEEAVSYIKSNDKIHIHPGAATPEFLIDKMVERANELENVEIYHLMTMGKANYSKPEHKNSFKHISFFAGGNVREAIKDGRAEHIPIFLSQIPYLFKNKVIELDVSLIQVSPPDAHGFCSFGIGVDVSKSAAENSKIVIAQVNKNMPRVHGDSFIHVSKIDFLVEKDTELFEIPRVRMTELEQKIAENIAPLIKDEATLQLGIGKIPDAVLHFLDDKRDLGVHTEMFSDGVVELVEKGVITCHKKTLHRSKLVSSFVMGTRKLYDFINDNPMCEFRPSHYVNDPALIRQNENMVSINCAISVDLTGQVNSDSFGYEIFSGIGGQVDFVRGAARSKNGKAIIALPSTAKDDTISRIVMNLAEGAGVVTSRGDVNYIATEFGIVNLFGKSIRERAKLLISIAHPKFREELTFLAKQHHFI